MREWKKNLIMLLFWVRITLTMPIFRSTCEVEACQVKLFMNISTRKCAHLFSALLHTSIFHHLPLQLVCPAWSFWKPFVISQLSPSWANAPGALVAFLLVVKHHCSFFLLFVLSFYILLHLLLPICWLRPAGPAVPTLISPPHSGQRAVVVTSYLILSFKHPVCELQRLSVDVRTFVFAFEILGCNVGWWHTMIGIVH